MKTRTGHDLPESFDGWLWPDACVVPRNELTMLVGYDGAGKSSFVLHLMAKATNGELSGSPERVYLSMAEDAPSITKARLVAHGADLDRVFVQPLRADGLTDATWVFPEDLEPFETYLAEKEITIAVIDSADYHIGEMAGQQARKTLGQLHEICERREVTLVLISHFNKGGRAVDQGIGGGRGVKAAMRCILVWGERPQTSREMLMAFLQVEEEEEQEEQEEEQEEKEEDLGTHVLAVHKNSYGKKGMGWAYTTKEIEHPFDPKETVLEFEYVGETETSANGIFLAQAHAAKTLSAIENKTDKARELIIRFLAAKAGEWVPAQELLGLVMAAGISQRTVENARSQLVKEGEIESRRAGGDRPQIEWRIKFTIPDAL